MESLLHEIAHYVALFIEAIAIAVIAIGAIEALIGVVRVLLHSETPTFLSFFLDREVEETRLRQHRGTIETATHGGDLTPADHKTNR